MTYTVTTDDVLEAVIYAAPGEGRGSRAFWVWYAAEKAKWQAEERERLGSATAWDERDQGLSDGHSESYRAGWRIGRDVGRDEERKRIAQAIEVVGNNWHPNATMERSCYRDAARIARQGGSGE